MVAERLGLWRLRDFELTRLPAPVDVHLFRAVGKNVPDDKRLVILTDVRDLTVLRDEAGHIRALPQLEHVLDACMDALRTARAADRGDARHGLEPRAALPVAGGARRPRRAGRGRAASSRPARRRWGWSRCSSSSGTPRTPEEEPQEYVLRMSRPPGAGLTVRVTQPPTRSRCASSTPTRRR